MTKKAPTAQKAPAHLQPATRQWFEQVVEGYDLADHHVRLLQLAAEAWDRCTEARQAISERGMVFVDSFGVPHPRPEVAIERDARLGFARLLRELDLDIEPPPSPPPRPPLLRSNRRAPDVPVKRRLAKARAELNARQLAYLGVKPWASRDLPLLEWIEHSQLWERGQPARIGHPNAVELWRLVGDEVLSEWVRERPGSRPATWWRDAAPERPRRGETEADCLLRLGRLTAAERRALGR